MKKKVDLGATVQMDRKNRRILKELIDDSRIPYSLLAKKVGLSRIGARDRVEQLRKCGIIVKFTTHVDYQLLGFQNVLVRWFFKNLTDEREKAFVEYVKSNPFIVKADCLSGSGGVDFQCDVLIQNTIELNNIIREMRKRFADIVSDYQCFDVIKEYKNDHISRFFFADLIGS